MARPDKTIVKWEPDPTSVKWILKELDEQTTVLIYLLKLHKNPMGSIDGMYTSPRQEGGLEQGLKIMKTGLRKQL